MKSHKFIIFHIFNNVDEMFRLRLMPSLDMKKWGWRLAKRSVRQTIIYTIHFQTLLFFNIKHNIHNHMALQKRSFQIPISAAGKIIFF